MKSKLNLGPYFLALIIWVFLWFRAYLNPLVFDEATTFFNYVLSGNYWPGKAYWSANNHLLNSLLSHGAYSVFGQSELALRLANLLAFPAFFYFLLQFLKILQKPQLIWIGLAWILLDAHPLEYFAFSRGYGLMFTGIMAMAWNYLRLRNDPKAYYILQIIVWAAFSLLSNLSALPLVSFILLISLGQSWNALLNKERLGLSLLSLLPIGYALMMSFQLKSHGQLYYGGENNFWQDSILSLGKAVPGIYSRLLAYLILLGLVLKQGKLNKQIFSLAFASSGLLIPLFYVSGHYLIELRYPFDRALLYWNLWLGLLVLFLAAKLSFRRKITLLIISLPFLLYNSASSSWRIYFSTHQGWRQEQIPVQYYQLALKEQAKSVGGSYLLAPQWNFYQLQYGGELSAFRKTSSPKTQFHLDLDDFENPRYSRLEKEVSSSLSLFTIKEAVYTQENPILLRQSIVGQSSMPLINFDRDSIPDALEIYLEIQLPQPPQKLMIAIQQFNAKGESLHFEAFEAKHYFKSPSEWHKWPVFVALDGMHQEVNSLVVLLWNPHSEQFSIKNLRVNSLNKKK